MSDLPKQAEPSQIDQTVQIPRQVQKETKPSNLKMNLVFAFILILSLLTSLAFYLIFGGGNITDLVIAKSVPRYPNATKWDVSASNCFISACDPGGIVFYITNDTAESVINFYVLELEKEGWDNTEINLEYGNPGSASFEKELNGAKYTLRVSNDRSLQYDSTQGGISICSDEN